MKIKAILFTVLLGFSVNALAVNALAVEQPVKEVTPLKAKFSADKKQAIRQDLDKLVALIKVQFEEQDKKQEALGDFSISTPEGEKKFLRFLLASNASILNEFKKLPLQTSEVNLLRQKFIQLLEQQLIGIQLMTEVGIDKSQTDPKFIALRQEFHQTENDFFESFRNLAKEVNFLIH